MTTYEYQKVPGMGVREELVAWEMLSLATKKHPEGVTQGDLVRQALERAQEICALGRAGLEVESHYIDWDKITDDRLDRGGW